MTQLLKNKQILWVAFAAVAVVLLSSILLVVLRKPSPHDAPTPPPSPPSTVLPVLDVFQFGAVGDGVTDDTAAIQRALNECNATGCVVWLPSNGTFYSYPISIMRDNTVLQIDGEVLLPSFTEARSKWKLQESYIPWLTIKNRYEGANLRGAAPAQNVTIQGHGRINGQGSTWWGEHEAKARPYMIYLLQAQHVVLKDLTLFEAPYFHVVPDRVQYMSIFNLIIKTNGSSPNTDGIDPRFSSNIHIYNTTISNGDDCIAIKLNCSNILVENCTFINGHGASIGSTPGTTHNVTFRNILFYNTSYGVRLKSQSEEPGVVSNITYDNLVLHRVKYAIHVTQFYLPVNTTRSNNSFTNVTISNIVSYNTLESEFFFDCSDNRPCTGFKLINIRSLQNTFGSNHYLAKCVSFEAQYSNVSPSLPSFGNKPLPPKGVLKCPPSSSSSATTQKQYPVS